MPQFKRRRAMKRVEQNRVHLPLMRWWKLSCRSFNLDERILVHVPNSARRGMIEGAMMKRLGTRAGFPDLVLFAPRGSCHGLMIELKKPDGVVSSEQTQIIALLRAQGYRAEVCYSTYEAINTITTYLAFRTSL